MAFSRNAPKKADHEDVGITPLNSVVFLVERNPAWPSTFFFQSKTPTKGQVPNERPEFQHLPINKNIILHHLLRFFQTLHLKIAIKLSFFGHPAPQDGQILENPSFHEVLATSAGLAKGREYSSASEAWLSKR